MRKSFISGLIIALLIFSTANLLARGNSSGGSTVSLKLANALSTEHTGNIIYRYFAEKVMEYSDRKIKITIYPNGTLGTTKELLEQAQAGTIDFVHSGGAFLENFSSEYSVFGLPYIFDSKEHFIQAMNGPMGKMFQTTVPEKLGLHGVLYLYGGTRSFYTTKPVKTIDDLSGLKIRVQPSNVAIKMVEAIGAVPTPMAFGEVYSALQQGVLDGAENNPSSYISARHYEVAKYYIFDEHQSIPDFLLMNAKKWDSLAPEQQQIISRAALEAQNKALADWDKQQEEAIMKAKATGSNFIYPNKAPYQDKVQSMIAERKKSDPTVVKLLKWIDQAR